MLVKSQLITQASGSLGGITAQRSRSGINLTKKRFPTNPNTSHQVAIRTTIAQLSSAWTELSQSQRDSWDLYAANVPVTNRLGDQIHTNGCNHFIRSNLPRIIAGMDRVNTGPNIFSLAKLGVVVMGPPNQVAKIGYVFSRSDNEWTNQNGAALLFYTGHAKGNGIKFYKGPFRYAGAIFGDEDDPPHPFKAITYATKIIKGALMWTKVRLTLADGRLSLPVILGPEKAI